GQGLDPRQARRAGGLDALVPEPPGMDAGDVLEDVDLDAEAVQGGLEASVDLVRAQPARGIDMGQAGNGDVLEQHGHAPGSLWEQASLASTVLNPGHPPQRQTVNRWVPSSKPSRGWTTLPPRPGASLRARIS